MNNIPQRVFTGIGISASPLPTSGGAEVVRLYLDVGKVHPVEVGEHLVDLGGVLEDGPGRLGQVVQAGVASQSLSKGTDHGHLSTTDTSRKSL